MLLKHAFINAVLHKKKDILKTTNKLKLVTQTQVSHDS